ncbi:MAG: hypothetical protein A2622_13850 [Bdellovibrionales bacterium RIFCSPHIGHO2_01_FULL_40_29]|nr:MAG: hypothetical protein A2622_13850 [Bdellovibrionales bacterium RIFCSPHIGHO2_01_FULL_40_29]OFZ35578.1 MAG: hypothetical protein A3D17_11360 [Bdellovibrionales bacterium RIFCSPHIGHO2_02_FULL_40_15]
MHPPVKIEFKNALSAGFLLVFSALFVATAVDQSLNKQIERVIQSPQGLSNIIWLWGALSMAASLLFPLIISLLCCHTLARPTVPRLQFVKSKLELGLIETLRAWGMTFIWSFAFIIPGLIKYTYYLLTPFVVMFSTQYERGEVDALKLSTEISKKFWWRLNFWLALFYFALPIMISSVLDEYRVFRLHPVTATLCVLLETFILFIFHFIMLKLFIKYLHEIEVPNGTDV